MNRFNHFALSVLAIATLALGSGCTDDEADSRTDPTDGTTKVQPSFETWVKDFAENPHTDILLPNPKNWFESQFEPKLAKALTIEYASIAKGRDGILAFFEKMEDSGKTEIRIRSVSEAIDLKANGLQNAALQRMNQQVPLYTVEFVKPGESSGTTLWSFAFVEGKYRFLGKMRALNPTRGDLATDVLCQMPLEPTGKMMQEKGLIDRPAAEYLKLKGVLK